MTIGDILNRKPANIDDEIAATKKLTDDWQTVAKLKTYPQAVADAILNSTQGELKMADTATRNRLVDIWNEITNPLNNRLSHDALRKLAKQFGVQIYWDAEKARAYEGYYQIDSKQGLLNASVRSRGFARIADILWMEQAKPDVKQAKAFVDNVNADPNANGVYFAINLSPSFNWSNPDSWSSSLTANQVAGVKKAMESASFDWSKPDTWGTHYNDVQAMMDAIMNFSPGLGRAGIAFQFVTIFQDHTSSRAIYKAAQALVTQGAGGFVRYVQQREQKERSRFVQHQTYAGVKRVEAEDELFSRGSSSTGAAGKDSTENQFRQSGSPATKGRKKETGGDHEFANPAEARALANQYVRNSGNAAENDQAQIVSLARSLANAATANIGALALELIDFVSRSFRQSFSRQHKKLLGQALKIVDASSSTEFVPEEWPLTVRFNRIAADGKTAELNVLTRNGMVRINLGFVGAELARTGILAYSDRTKVNATQHERSQVEAPHGFSAAYDVTIQSHINDAASLALALMEEVYEIRSVIEGTTHNLAEAHEKYHDIFKQIPLGTLVALYQSQRRFGQLAKAINLIPLSISRLKTMDSPHQRAKRIRLETAQQGIQLLSIIAVLEDDSGDASLTQSMAASLEQVVRSGGGLLSDEAIRNVARTTPIQTLATLSQQLTQIQNPIQAKAEFPTAALGIVYSLGQSVQAQPALNEFVPAVLRELATYNEALFANAHTKQFNDVLAGTISFAQESTAMRSKDANAVTGLLQATTLLDDNDIANLPQIAQMAYVQKTGQNRVTLLLVNSLDDFWAKLRETNAITQALIQDAVTNGSIIIRTLEDAKPIQLASGQIDASQLQQLLGGTVFENSTLGQAFVLDLLSSNPDIFSLESIPENIQDWAVRVLIKVLDTFVPVGAGDLQKFLELQTTLQNLVNSQA